MSKCHIVGNQMSRLIGKHCSYGFSTDDRLDNSRIDVAVEAGKFTPAITVHGSFGFRRTWNLTNIQARYVKVSTHAHQYLTLCEVEIYGVVSNRGKT